MDDSSPLQQLATEFALVLAPLADAARAAPDGSGLVQLVARLGWDLERHVSGVDLDVFATVISDAYEGIEAVREDPEQWPELLVANRSLVAAAVELSNLGSAQLDTPELVASFGELGENLIDYLVVRYVQARAPLLHAFLVLLGIIKVERITPAHPRPGYMRWDFDWDGLVTVFSDPAEQMSRVYGWGFDLDAWKLLSHIQQLLLTLRIPARFQLDDPDDVGALDPDRAAGDPVLRIPVVSGYVEDIGAVYEAGVALVATRQNPEATSYWGIGATPFARGQVGQRFEISDGWGLRITAEIDATSPYGLTLSPDAGLAFSALGLADPVSGQILFGLDRSAASGVVLLGSPTGSHLRATSVGIQAGAAFGKGPGPEAKVEAEIAGATIAIRAGEGDALLGKVLPPEGLEIDFDFLIGWTSYGGLYFGGSAMLEIQIPAHLSLGPVELETILLRLELAEGQVLASAGITIRAELGPFKAVVKRFGVTAGVTLSRSPDVGFHLLPPTSAGFSIDAGITGGGFLEFDTDNERYAGILALKLGEIGITAIGLITTKMPDGSKGFSMLVNVGVVFDPPFQLSMGFTLSGIGGLIGVNRTMMVDVLREGVKKGTLDSILFPEPEWVIPNADRVISDLRAVFPPHEGRFVIGPMVKIGYGSPNFIVADIGIFLELFDDIKAVVLAQLAMQLPSAEEDIVRIKLDIVGVLDFEKQEISFQASLYDSGILTFELFGDAAFFMSWGAEPQFAMSLGGFHPNFTPPPPPIVFADMRRLGLNLSSGEEFQLSCGVYQALTPNSLQFGARADLYAAAMGAEVTGWLSFDTLIYFEPLSFDVDIGAGVNIRYQGASLADVRITLTLSGPTPWNARGSAKIDLFLFDINVDFDITWGRPDQKPLEPIDPWPQLEAALKRPESWGARLPPRVLLAESLRDIEADPEAEDEEPPLVVHPAGTLEVRQNVAPLATTLQKFGNAPVKGHNRFRIDAFSTKGGEIDVAPVDEFFARGQFEKLNNHQKLSVPSFEKMPGGATSSAIGLLSTAGDAEHSQLGYDTILIQSDKRPLPPTTAETSSVDWGRQGRLVTSAAAARRACASKGRDRFMHGGGARIATLEPKYEVVRAEDLTPALLDEAIERPDGAMTRMEADRVIADQIARDSGAAERLIVVAEFEVQRNVA